METFRAGGMSLNCRFFHLSLTIDRPVMGSSQPASLSGFVRIPGTVACESSPWFPTRRPRGGPYTASVFRSRTCLQVSPLLLTSLRDLLAQYYFLWRPLSLKYAFPPVGPFIPMRLAYPFNRFRLSLSRYFQSTYGKLIWSREQKRQICSHQVSSNSRSTALPRLTNVDNS